MRLKDLKDKTVVVYGSSYFDIYAFDKLCKENGVKRLYLIDDYYRGWLGHEYICSEDVVSLGVDFILIPSHKDEVIKKISEKCLVGFIALKNEPELLEELRHLYIPIDVMINVANHGEIFDSKREVFNTILFDTVRTCNIKCVYCFCDKNLRTNEKVSLESFDKFISNVKYFKDFQHGCSFEPTMDSRMTDFLLTIAKYTDFPINEFRIQTNGTLLHKHDFGAIKDAGVNMLNVSLDSVDSEVLSYMRGGTDLEQVVGNIKNIMKSNDGLRLRIVSVVSSVNVDGLEELIRFGLNNGAVDFIFRGMESTFIKDQDLKQKLVMNEAQEEYVKSLVDKYCKRTGINYISANEIITTQTRQQVDSGFIKK